METTTAPTATQTFEVGQAYDTGRGDYVWTFEVVKRTAKFLTIRDEHGQENRVGVSVWNHGGVPTESALPLGRYSMAPVIFADRPAIVGEDR